jgi:Na+/melibiose symporter-like transporter
MLTNLLQPLGALLSNRTQSRHSYGMRVLVPSRLLWVLLVLGIMFVDRPEGKSKQLVYLTLALLLTTNILAALGAASWMSWLAALVPPRLRGRYYSVRNIACSLANLLCLPIGSFVVSNWRGSDEIAGYGMVLAVAIISGIASLGCQQLMIDINPQDYRSEQAQTESLFARLTASLADRNLVIFLIYFALWAFAVNLSTPFFNLYMLDNLNVELPWLTLFSSIGSCTNMLMLIVWGRIIDRFGSRPLLICAGLVVTLMPLFWLITDLPLVRSQLAIWLAVFHVFWGGLWAAIDLGNNNIQIAIVPIEHHATFFALAAAVAGVCGALGTTAGGMLMQYAHYEGIFGVFSLSAILRFVAIIPLLFVKE